MSYRPAGTDGSDYNYRQTIDNKYKKLPQLRRTAALLAHCQVIAVALSCCWHLLIEFMEGTTPGRDIAYPTAASLVSILLWHLGRPGGSRESLAVLSMSAVASLVSMGSALVLFKSGFCIGGRDTTVVEQYLKTHFGSLAAIMDARAWILLKEGGATFIAVAATAAAAFYAIRYITEQRATLQQVRSGKYAGKKNA